MHEIGIAQLHVLELVEKLSAIKYKFVVQPVDFKEHLQRFTPHEDFDINAVAGTAINLWSNYAENPTLSTGRGGFKPDGEFKDLMECIKALGWAEKAGDSYVWTDSAAPVMRIHHLWNENLQSSSEIRRLTEHQIAEKIWLSMSTKEREQFARLFGRDVISLTAYLLHRWNGAEFAEADLSKADQVLDSSIGIPVARDLMSRMEVTQEISGQKQMAVKSIQGLDEGQEQGQH